MRRQLQRAVRRWLDHESEERAEQADRALFEVFAHLPLPPLPSGFTEMVLIRAGLATEQEPGRTRALVWAFRGALSVCLALAALSLLHLPSILPSLLGLVHPGRVTELGLDALVGVFHRLGVGLVVWRALSAIGEILSSAFASPPYLTALLTSALLSIGAFGVLHNLILAERSSHDVRSA